MSSKKNAAFVVGVNATVIPEKFDVKGKPTVVRSFGGLVARQGPGNTVLINSQAFIDAHMYNFASQTSSIFAKGIMLGWDNPNYDVQVLMLSAGMKW